MNDIIVFLDGYEAFKGDKEAFKKGISSTYIKGLVDRLIEEGHIIDSEQGDFEMFTMNAFVESGLSYIDIEIKSYERQLEDCHEDYIEVVKKEIERLKKLKKEEEGK